MTWNFDISEAPRGRMEPRQRTTKDGVSTWEEYVPDHIIAASVCGKVTRSYWIPKEERWCMFTKDAPPKAWQPWPDHPDTITIERTEEREQTA